MMILDRSMKWFLNILSVLIENGWDLFLDNLMAH